jgi:hypothetical protein
LDCGGIGKGHSKPQRSCSCSCIVVSVLILRFDAMQVLRRDCSMLCDVLEGRGMLLEGGVMMGRDKINVTQASLLNGP